MRALYSGEDGGSWQNDLSNSLGFTAGRKLTYTPTVTGNRRQFTIMCNVRRVKHGTSQYIYGDETGGIPTIAYFNTNDKLVIYSGGGAAGGEYISTRRFRDVEWMFVGIAYDSVARTIRVVINDEEIDQWDTKSIPNANFQTAMNWSGARMTIGAYNNAAGVLEAIVSDYVILDGEVLTPQEMITYRTQNVPHGNGVNVTTKKFTTEGEQERFFDWTKNNAGASDPIPTNEGQTVSSATVAWRTLHTPVLTEDGKYQIEMTVASASSYQAAGAHKASHYNNTVNQSFNDYAATGGTGVYYARNGNVGHVHDNTQTLTRSLSEFPALTTGDRVSYYIDMPNRKMYFAVNGVFATGHNPTAGTGGFTITSGDVRFFTSYYSAGAETELNIGQTDYVYPVSGYGALKEPAKSDLKRCKLLPVTHASYGLALENRGLSAQNTGAAWAHAYSNFVMSSGKHYIEYEVGADLASVSWGITANPDVINFASNTDVGSGLPQGSLGHYFGAVYYSKSYTATWVVTSGTAVQGDITSIAVDVDNKKFWQAVNGVWLEGNPSTGTGGITMTDSEFRVFLSIHANTGGLFNFGDSPWKQTPPTGFKGPAEFDFDTLRKSGDTTNYEYGPNGTQLLFEDASDFGKSSAGNLISWTNVGFTSGLHFTDTPGDPYAIMSHIDQAGANISSGGRYVTAPSSTTVAMGRATMPLMESGTYWEARSTSTGTDGFVCICHSTKTMVTTTGAALIGNVVGEDDFYYRTYNGTLKRNGGASNTVPELALAAGERVCMAYKNGNFWVGTIKSGVRTWYNGGNPETGANPTEIGFTGIMFAAFSITSLNALVFDFGQQGFEVEPPAGFKELKNSNKETPKYHGGDKVDVNKWLGDGSGDRQIYTELDGAIHWYKAIDGGANTSHLLYDKNRGIQKYLIPNSPNQETTLATGLSSFAADGPNVGSWANQSGQNRVMWSFANDGTLAANNEGSIATQVMVDSSGYMTQVYWDGDGASGATIGTGEDDIELFISKSRDNGTYSWHTWAAGLPDDYYLAFDSNGGQDNSVNIFPSAGRTSRLMQLATSSIKYNNLSGQRYFGWGFKSVPGICSIQVMKGNTSVNGWYMHCGFMPRLVWFKRMFGGVGAWTLIDTSIDSNGNPMREELNIDTSATVTTAGGDRLDFTANGIKCRNSGVALNDTGSTYLVVAFAEAAGGGNLPALLGN